MVTSTFKGYVRFDPTVYADNDRPVHAGISRDQLINNALHLADEQAQTLINWSMSTTSSYLTPPAGFSANTYYRVARFGPVPLSMREDGGSYKLRVRMRFFASNAATIKGRVVVCAPAESVSVRDSSTATNAATFTSTSTSDAWDDADSSNIFSLTAADMLLTMQERSTYAAVGGASVSVAVPMPIVDVYLRSTSAGSTPRLTGIYLAEYVGV